MDEFEEERSYQAEHPVKYFFFGYKLKEKWQKLLLGEMNVKLTQENERLKLEIEELKDKFKEEKHKNYFSSYLKDMEIKKLKERIEQGSSNKIVKKEDVVRFLKERVNLAFYIQLSDNRLTPSIKIARLFDSSEISDAFDSEKLQIGFITGSHVINYYVGYMYEYNTSWRIWKSKPTKEELKAPWM